ncbi:mRNA interferase RelE/StbE [Azospirillaceae bacterium]
MPYVVHLTNRAEKGLRKLPAADLDRILSALEEMESDPLAGDVVKLKGSDHFRRRVGNYRIVFSVDGERVIVVVMDVLRRTSTTY